MKVILDVIHCDKMKNNFMHAVDVFQDSKQLGELSRVEITGEPEIEKLVDRIKDAFEKQNKTVVFCAIHNVDCERYKHPNAFIMDGVSQISSGNNWVMFHEMLKKMGYIPQTNELMQVIGI